MPSANLNQYPSFQIAQAKAAGSSTASLTTSLAAEQKKLTNNIGIDTKSAGAASSPAWFPLFLSPLSRVDGFYFVWIWACSFFLSFFFDWVAWIVNHFQTVSGRVLGFFVFCGVGGFEKDFPAERLGGFGGTSYWVWALRVVRIVHSFVAVTYPYSFPCVCKWQCVCLRYTSGVLLCTMGLPTHSVSCYRDIEQGKGVHF